MSADSVSPRMTTVTSRDEFKPIRLGETLAVNYNPTTVFIPVYYYDL